MGLVAAVIVYAIIYRVSVNNITITMLKVHILSSYSSLITNIQFSIVYPITLSQMLTGDQTENIAKKQSPGSGDRGQ